MPEGQDLSGGEWQQLALGQTMMCDHPLLLALNEPTASLDAPTETALRTVQKGQLDDGRRNDPCLSSTLDRPDG